MPQILDQRTSMDQTVRIFDSFYAITLTIHGNEYDIVRGNLFY